MIEAFIDTSFSVALVNERDLDHDKALALSNLHNSSSLIITDCVLLEIGNSLARKNRTQAIAIINSFLTSKQVEVVHLTPELFHRAFELYRSRIDKSWGLVDCVSFVVMRDRGIEIALTSDRHFLQAGFRALMLEDESS